MEPLILARYSRALGDVGPDSVTPRPPSPPNDDLFAARSHVLDLLNTTHVVSYASTLELYEEVFIYHDGVGLAIRDLKDVNLPPGATARLRADGATGDTLALITSLSNSVLAAQSQPVATVRLHTNDGRVLERQLRAGVDTAEWAHERADVRAAIKHQLANVYDSRAGDAANSYLANRYWTRLALGARARFNSVEITNVSQGATLTVWKASIVDATNTRSAPLAVDTRSEFWQQVYEQNGVQILRNKRALPRAWLVAEAEAVDAEEALRRIRGESPHTFDPRRTALLEVRPDELPQLSGVALTWERMTARVVAYQPNRFEIDTDALAPTVLVVSEIFYPGWEATVDGQPARILLTDYLLRGVALPPGRHRVEMHYTAPGARAGAIISACTLLLLGGLFIYARRQAPNDGSTRKARGMSKMLAQLRRLRASRRPAWLREVLIFVGFLALTALMTLAVGDALARCGGRYRRLLCVRVGVVVGLSPDLSRSAESLSRQHLLPLSLHARVH